MKDLTNLLFETHAFNIAKERLVKVDEEQNMVWLKMVLK